MELEKSPYSGKAISNKMVIDCSDPSFFKLQNLLYRSNNDGVMILNAMYANNIKVVLKFNSPFAVENEYRMSYILDSFPNYIKYLRAFDCAVSIQNILSNKDDLENYGMCKSQGKNIGVLVMKYYPLGSIDSYAWNKENFELLKNIMLQVIYASIYAYEKKQFVHGDLHLGNVLLEFKNHDVIHYGSKFLNIDNVQAIIMDFENSTTGIKTYKKMLEGITKFVFLTFQSIDFFVVHDNERLQNIKFINSINYDYYEEFYEIITQASIRA